MATKKDSIAIKEAIEEIEKMIEDYKKPKPLYPGEKKGEDATFRLFSQFTGDMISQGLERALEVLKKRVI